MTSETPMKEQTMAQLKAMVAARARELLACAIEHYQCTPDDPRRAEQVRRGAESVPLYFFEALAATEAGIRDASPALPVDDLTEAVEKAICRIEAGRMLLTFAEKTAIMLAAISQQQPARGEVCGDNGKLCPACSVPAHELTQVPGCGGPLPTPSEGDDDVARELLAAATEAHGRDAREIRAGREHLEDRIALAAIRAALARAGQGYGRGVREDVRRLVIAARNVAFGDIRERVIAGNDDELDAAIRELDQASEAFAADVPWQDQP